MSNDPTLHPASVPVHAIENLALVDATRRALANFVAALLVEARYPDPRVQRHNLLRHLSQSASRVQAIVALGVPVSQDANFALWTGSVALVGARRGDVLVGLKNREVLVVHLDEGFYGNAGVARSRGGQFRAQGARRVNQGCAVGVVAGPVHAAGHELEAVLAAESAFVTLGLARSKLQEAANGAQGFEGARGRHAHGHSEATDDPPAGPAVHLPEGCFVRCGSAGPAG